MLIERPTLTSFLEFSLGRCQAPFFVVRNWPDESCLRRRTVSSWKKMERDTSRLKYAAAALLYSVMPFCMIVIGLRVPGLLTMIRRGTLLLWIMGSCLAKLL